MSTAYSNCKLAETIEERVYPLPQKATEMIASIQSTSGTVTPRPYAPELLGYPNSYTASKAITECLVVEEFAHLPVTICRPSIVTHSHSEPVPGWCDSLNGVAGLFLSYSLGVMRTMEMDGACQADLIPVDFVANSLIVVGYHSAVNPKSRHQVVHITSDPSNPIYCKQVLDFPRETIHTKPSMKMIRPLVGQIPDISERGWLGLDKVNRLVTLLFSQILFAWLYDCFLMMVMRRKPILMKVTQRMQKACDVVEPFTTKQWTFQHDNYPSIYKQLTQQDRTTFFSDASQINWHDYCCHSLYMGTRRYLLKEEDSTFAKGKERLHLLIRTEKILKAVGWIVLACLAYAIFF